MEFKPFDPFKGGMFASATITLTIGCNVDDKPELTPEGVWAEAHKYVNQHLEGYEVSEGEWEGIPEVSVSIRVPFVWSYALDHMLENDVRKLCDALRQDAIGVWDVYGGSTLVYGTRWYEKQAREKTA